MNSGDEAAGAVSPPDYSVIVTCFNEAEVLPAFHERLVRTLVDCGRRYEVIYVNDGSSDETWSLLEGFFEDDLHVRCVIDLYRNVGQISALTAALGYARGRRFLFLDSDLELDPEEIPRFIEKAEEGFDVVSGLRTGRRGPWYRMLFSRLANRILNMFSASPLRDLGCGFKVVDGPFLRAFNYGPYGVLQPAALVARAGRLAEVPVVHHARERRRSRWGMRQLLNHFAVQMLSISPFWLLIWALGLASVAPFLTLVAGILRAGADMPGWMVHMEWVLTAMYRAVTGALVAFTAYFALATYNAVQRRPAYVVRVARVRE